MQVVVAEEPIQELPGLAVLVEVVLVMYQLLQLPELRTLGAVAAVVQ
jgi:hypothetical protein